MKRELEHFYIGEAYGGSQDWFPTFMMRMGGCAAETACDSSIYFALHRGLADIAPDNAGMLTKYADHIWHWFLLNGYDDTGDAFLVKTVTYGGFEWLAFGELWNPGFSKRGGLVLYQGL